VHHPVARASTSDVPSTIRAPQTSSDPRAGIDRAPLKAQRSGEAGLNDARGCQQQRQGDEEYEHAERDADDRYTRIDYARRDQKAGQDLEDAQMLVALAEARSQPWLSPWEQSLVSSRFPFSLTDSPGPESTLARVGWQDSGAPV
jgi:hypothetical protein